jgi:hypothetical protein
MPTLSNIEDARFNLDGTNSVWCVWGGLRTARRIIFNRVYSASYVF